MELTEYITDLLVDFDEMGFVPITPVPNPDAYAIEWRNKIVKAFEKLTNEKYDIECSYNSIKKDNERLHASCTEYAQKLASLTKENAQLKHIELEALRGVANNYKEMYKKLTEENKKLTINMNAYGLTAKRLCEENERLRAEVKQSKIKWVNRPISAQYATVTDENGEKHYGKVHDFIENNLVGYCGECGKRLDDSFMNFCPNCGAKMKGE